MTLGRRPTITDGLAVGMRLLRPDAPEMVIRITGLTPEAVTYVIESPPANASPHQLTLHRPAFARSVAAGEWIEAR